MDGQHILVGRIWPREVRKEALQDAVWLKNIAPSAALRRWFGHQTARWAEFRTRYWAELDGAPDALATLEGLMKKGPVTLLYAARDTKHNHAVALRDYLERRRRGST